MSRCFADVSQQEASDVMGLLEDDILIGIPIDDQQPSPALDQSAFSGSQQHLNSVAAQNEPAVKMARFGDASASGSLESQLISERQAQACVQNVEMTSSDVDLSPAPNAQPSQAAQLADDTTSKGNVTSEQNEVQLKTQKSFANAFKKFIAQNASPAGGSTTSASEATPHASPACLDSPPDLPLSSYAPPFVAPAQNTAQPTSFAQKSLPADVAAPGLGDPLQLPDDITASGSAAQPDNDDSFSNTLDLISDLLEAEAPATVTGSLNVAQVNSCSPAHEQLLNDFEDQVMAQSLDDPVFGFPTQDTASLIDAPQWSSALDLDGLDNLDDKAPAQDDNELQAALDNLDNLFTSDFSHSLSPSNNF